MTVCLPHELGFKRLTKRYRGRGTRDGFSYKEREKCIQKLSGTVVSDVMDKTRVIEVKRRAMHKRYKKFITKTKRFLVEDSNSFSRNGDHVEFVTYKPISKRKRWVITKITGKTNQQK